MVLKLIENNTVCQQEVRVTGGETGGAALLSFQSKSQNHVFLHLLLPRISSSFVAQTYDVAI